MDEFEVSVKDTTDSELLLKLIFENSREALACLEKIDGKYYYLLNNREHQRITGFSCEKIVGKQIRDVLGEPYYEAYELYCDQCIDSGKTVLFKGTARWNGMIESRMCRLTPIVWKNRFLISVAELDVASLQDWMRDNHLSVTRFIDMFEAHSSMMLLIEPESGIIIDANCAAVDFYGYSREELIGMPIQKINTMKEEEVEASRIRALRGEDDYFLFQHRLKSGEKRWVDVHSSPIEIDGIYFLYSIITDATERVDMERVLFREKELQKITMDSIGDCVVTTDQYGKITYLNNAAALVTGWSTPEVRGKEFDDIFPMINENTCEKVSDIVEMVLKTKEIQELANHTMLKTKAGKLIPIEDSAAPIMDKKGMIHGVVVIFRDVTLEKQKKKRIEFLSYHDTLTSLYNRNFYNLFMEEESVQEKYPIGFILGDVNGLKMTNDVFGHTLGDLLLKSIADVMRNCCGEHDVVVRWGGDEFLLLIPNTTMNELDDKVKQIKSELLHIKINDAIEASVSFGTALMKENRQTFDSVLKVAEEIMYQTKLIESKSMRGNTINALMITLDEKSAETKEHTLRLSDICLKIADKLGHHIEKKNRLSLLSVLHDIGKVGIPDYVLEKPGSLTADEWNIMRSHSEIGYRIASNVTELHGVAEEILYHHEKWDGTGYPAGLKGGDIPINCRILAVVDAYDAMTNDRIYRKAIPKEVAISEIYRCAGTQFDPQIVNVFAGII